MRYKGYIIELNPYGQKGFDYVFYLESDCDEPVGIGRSIANCKNQIDIFIMLMDKN